MSKKKPADEDVLGELPDLIGTLETALEDLRNAVTVETQADLLESLVSANVTIDRVKSELRDLLQALRGETSP